MTWLALGGGLALGALIAWLSWRLGRVTNERDAERAGRVDAERRLDEIDRSAQEALKRQEGVIRVLRSQRDAAQRDLAALSPRDALRFGLQAAAAAVGEADPGAHAEVPAGPPAPDPGEPDRGGNP